MCQCNICSGIVIPSDLPITPMKSTVWFWKAIGFYRWVRKNHPEIHSQFNEVWNKDKSVQDTIDYPDIP